MSPALEKIFKWLLEGAQLNLDYVGRGFAWPPGICWGNNTSTRPRRDSDGQSPSSHRGDTGWIPGHVRFIVGKMVLGQI